jgi:two-component system cell cycle response regulator
MARILVIDDDRLKRRAVVDILAAAGHDSLEASEADEGLDMARRHRPALVITVVVLAYKDGLEIISELRQEAYPGAIVAIANGHPSRGSLYLGLAKSMGADEVLAEPFSATALVEAVNRVL